jgi:putative PEP-CTERM system TPR-repeat lipoprotein
MKKPTSVISTVISTALLAAFLGGCGGEDPAQLIASSKEFLAKNDNKAAVIQLKNALQADPNLGEARFLLGKALLASGDGAGAEVELRKAFNLKYANDDVVPLLAQAMLANGQAKKVTDEFAATELGTNQAKASLKTVLSTAWAVQGKNELANDELASALAAQADYAPALLAQSRQKAITNDLPGALAIVDGVLATNPKDHDALLLAGSLLAAKADSQGALDRYRQAVAAKPDSLMAHSAVVSTLFQLRKPEDAAQQIEAMKAIAPKHPQTLYLSGQSAYQRKDFKAAREISQELLKLTPDNVSALLLAGASEFQLRSYVQAEAHLTKLLQKNPNMALGRRLLVATYLRSGQASKAMAALQPALEQIDNDPALLALAGETYLMNGDADKSAEFFAKAAKLDPDNKGKQVSVAIAHLAQGKSGALTELEQIASTDSGTSADLALIATHLKAAQLDKALKAIDTLEKKQPDNPATHNLRARTLLGKKDLAGARASFNKALQLNPTFFPAAASLAALDLADKKPEEARKRFEAILAAEPKHAQALLATAELASTTGSKPEEVEKLIGDAVLANPQDIPARLALIQHHLKNKDNKKAMTAANDAAAAIPDRPEILDALGRTQQLSGDTNQALNTYGKLATLQPSSPLAHMRLAEIHLAEKNRGESVKNLRKALEIRPDLLDAQRGLILFAIEDKKTAEALAVTRQIQQQRPKEAIGFSLEGDVHATVRSWPEAIKAYRAGLKLQPSPELAIKLFSALTASGNSSEAERWAATWMKDYPKDIALRMHQGDMATTRKDYASAAQIYRAALEIQPENPLILNNLAWASGQLKSPKAIEYAEKAHRLAPNQPAIMDTLAMLLAEKGDHAQAIELLRKAMQIAPQATLIQLNLAKVLINSGQKDAARKELDELAKLGDKFPGQAEVARLQKEL